MARWTISRNAPINKEPVDDLATLPPLPQGLPSPIKASSLSAAPTFEEIRRLNEHNIKLLQQQPQSIAGFQGKFHRVSVVPCSEPTTGTPKRKANGTGEEPERVPDPGFRRVTRTPIKKLQVLTRTPGGEPAEREILVRRIYTNPEVRLAEGLFSPEECSWLLQFASSRQWAAPSYEAPESCAVNITETIETPSLVRSLVKRLRRAGDVADENATADLIFERIPITSQYPRRLTRGAHELRSLPLAVVFLSSGGGKMDFYRLGFAAQPCAGSAIIISSREADWHDLLSHETDDENGAEKFLFLCFFGRLS